MEMYKSNFQSHNPWWTRKELVLEDVKLSEFEKMKYKYIPKILKNPICSIDAIFTLRGPRQIGKTTLIKLMIKKLLLEDKKQKEAIFFYPCDRIADYNELFSLISEYLNYARPRVHERLYIFLDEISFVKEWMREIKELADSGKLKNATLFITGSNILDLKISSERMPGRRGEIFSPDIEILPLDFHEFLSLVKPEILNFDSQEAFNRHFPELQKLFEDYILTGGFLPNINQYFEKGYIPSYLYEIYLNWIEGDLHKVGKSAETFIDMSGRIAKHLTSTVSKNKLAKESGLASYTTAEGYLDILEKMFVLFSLKYFSIDEKKRDLKKNQKIYFLDQFIMQAAIAKNEGFLDEAFTYVKNIYLKNEMRPMLAEMMVGIYLKKKFNMLYYGQLQKREVDFVVKHKGKYLLYEVKYQNNIKINDFAIFQSNLKKTSLTVITPKVYEKKHNIFFVPLEIFLGYKL